MKITAVDNTNRLFLVEDLLPQHLVDQIQNTAWNSIAWKRGEMQEHWLRRHLENTDTLNQINDFIHKIDFGIITGLAFTTWWYDEPNFSVPIHTDGHLPSALQMFWIAESEDRGTVFYNSKNPTDVRYHFQFRPNTGYLMLNHLDKDGSQPLQWHGMLNTTTKYRITSYTVLGECSVK